MSHYGLAEYGKLKPNKGVKGRRDVITSNECMLQTRPCTETPCKMATGIFCTVRQKQFSIIKEGALQQQNIQLNKAA